MIKLHYCSEVNCILPSPYRPVLSFIRESNKGEVSAKAVPSLYTGSYNPLDKEVSLPMGVWVSIISGATIDPVAWLDISELQSTIDASYLKKLENMLSIKFKEASIE